MDPKLIEVVIDVAQSMREIAKDKSRSVSMRIRAADTIVGLLGASADFQHNVTDRIMVEQGNEAPGPEPEPWR